MVAFTPGMRWVWCGDALMNGGRQMRRVCSSTKVVQNRACLSPGRIPVIGSGSGTVELIFVLWREIAEDPDHGGPNGCRLVPGTEEAIPAVVFSFLIYAYP